MDKQHILEEIKRTAKYNGGMPLGTKRFLAETGIKTSDWYGKIWTRWGDALIEAGFSPNQLQKAYDPQKLIQAYISLIRELGHFPTAGEVRLKEHNDSKFPSHTTFSRFGSKRQFAAKIIGYCREHHDFEDVIEICLPIQAKEHSESKCESRQSPSEELGYVYMLKSGGYYKIGKTNAAGRRERELAIQLPEKANTVHIIKTDDPAGIESYWHKRFEAKRKHGEWFELSSAEVNAFKRRKFM
jgi:hypothetical protein